jgi:hypothetical protein
MRDRGVTAKDQLAEIMRMEKFGSLGRNLALIEQAGKTGPILL